jgi:hypothetical protein
VSGFTVDVITGIPTGGTIVATTGTVTVAGDYYVNSAALVTADAGDAVLCYLSTVNDGNVNDGINGGFTNFFSTNVATGQAAVAERRTVAVGDAIVLYCYTQFNLPNSAVDNAYVTATLINIDNGVVTAARHAQMSPRGAGSNGLN